MAKISYIDIYTYVSETIENIIIKNNHEESLKSTMARKYTIIYRKKLEVDN
jgi:hypothetical protein